MRLAVVTLGSAGDLHPYLAIAREMHRQGHEVHFLSQAPHRAAVEAEGVRFTPIATERDHNRTLRHPGLWDPIRGFGVLWRHLCAPAIRPTIDALSILSSGAAGPLTVMASPLAVGARLLREARSDTRLITAYTAPSALRSVADPMFLGAWQAPRWLPRGPRFLLWQGLDAWKLDPLARPVLDSQRALLGLGKQLGSTFGHWIHSPDGGLALFPEWFAPAQTDWPLQPAFAGFPVFEPRTAETGLEDELSRFLGAGDPPVVIYAGSAAFAGGAFLRLASSACRALDKRCVILSPYAEQWPAADGDWLVNKQSAPLCALLPRSNALIHHGGMGTCAQALAARRPQLIIPSAYDQFDNGFRIEQIGMGVSRYGRRAQLKQVTDTLKSLLDATPTVMRSPQALGKAAIEWPEVSFADEPNSAVRRACEILLGEMQSTA